MLPFGAPESVSTNITLVDTAFVLFLAPTPSTCPPRAPSSSPDANAAQSVCRVMCDARPFSRMSPHDALPLQELAEKDVRKRIAAIEDEIHMGREKAYADAVYYAHIKEAESNDRLLTDNFLEYTRILR